MGIQETPKAFKSLWGFLDISTSYDRSHDISLIISCRFYFVDDNTGITKAVLPKVTIYPNPTSDIFTVDYENFNQVKIYDMLGKEVLAQDTNGKAEINISRLPKGIYNVIVLSEGKVVGKSKIVKQ